MYDLIYDEGRVVAYIKLGAVYTQETNVKTATVSEGKIYSFSGRLVGYVRNATDISPDKSLSASFRMLLNITA